MVLHHKKKDYKIGLAVQYSTFNTVFIKMRVFQGIESVGEV